MTARPEMDERLLDEALGWQHALEAEDADWDGYVLWLEADPRHREAFDAVALTDRIVADHRDDLHLLTAPPPPEAMRSTGRRTWLVGSVAAALALAIGIPAFRPMSADDIVYTTAPGQTRRIALAGGTAIDLAPGSRLLVKSGDADRLELASGEAYFAVDHDPGRTLSIKAGDYAVSDIGTKFAINLAADTMLVSVAEGNVTVGLGDAASAERVSAGQRFTASRAGGTPRVTQIASATVGGWRQGRLAYENSPLSLVASDISRYVGKTVVVDPAISTRRFSGVLVIGDGTKLLANLADFMAVSYRVEGDRVRLVAAGAR